MGCSEGAEDKKGREGTGVTQYAHPGRPGHRQPGNSDNCPLRIGSECEGGGGGALEQSGLLSHNEQSI